MARFIWILGTGLWGRQWLKQGDDDLESADWRMFLPG
jgi:hypothetical protein